MFTSGRMFIAATALLVSSAVAMPVQAAIRYVNAARPNDSGDGLTWATAERTLQAALQVAGFGDQIRVAAGTYEPDQGPGITPGNRLAKFQLESGVAIYGGFAGTETLLAQRDVAANPTILSGDLNSNDIGFTNNGENSFHVASATGTTAAALLDGFTVTGGNANGAFPNDNNGGLELDTGHATIRRCVFRGNSAAQTGGGLAAGNSNSSITDCVFSGNRATFGGGVRFSF